MIGEGNVVEIVVLVVGIERAPSAVLALHPHDPFPGPGDRAAEVGLGIRALHAIHRHHHDRGIIDVRVVRIGVLKRPAAGTDIGPPRDPIAFDVEDLPGHQPFKTFAGVRRRVLATDLEQGMADEAGVPDRRDARLAIGLVLVHDQQLLDRLAGDGALRMMFRIAEHVEHHHAVRHRREDRTKTIFAVEPLADPRHRAVDRAAP